MTDNQHLDYVIRSIAYVNEFRGKTILIKLGGSILNDEALIISLCDDLKVLTNCGIKIVVVHGGGHAINKQLALQNVTSEFLDGLRVTSSEAMQVIEMVLCGQVNPLLIRKLNSVGLNAVGLSGADSNMLQCEYHSQAHGCVGMISAVNTSPISQVISHLAIPVIAPIGVVTGGSPVNINADYAASHIASAMKVDKLIYVTDQDGIYDKTGSVYSKLSSNDLLSIIHDQTVQGGMLTKVRAILSALNGQLKHVHILNGHKRHVLIEELFTEQGVGTLCYDENKTDNQDFLLNEFL